MGLISKGGLKNKKGIEIVSDNSDEDIVFTIQDTEYLLRKLVEAKIDGREVEQASEVMKKVKELHRRLMEQGVAVNSG